MGEIMEIFARKTIIKQIEDKDADDFIVKYHDQGSTTFGGDRFNVGCFYDNECVGVASFSNSRTKGKARLYQQELVRMAFKTDVQVIGGASKMIKFYIDTFKPRNFFTYQTLSGKRTDVYEYAGMELVSVVKSKTVLVKNGYTYQTALSAPRKKGEYLFLNKQLANLGPDNLLKTNFGTLVENGVQLTNEEIFVKYCGYHVETIPGDRVYEYQNPDYRHYIYKITSTNPEDNRYYIGRRSVYDPQQLIELENEGYMGSGGVKFQNWKKSILEKGFTLNKEIIGTYPTWDDAVAAEKKLVGDNYKTDALCLNSTSGGVSVDSLNNVDIQHCDEHGFTKFSRGECCKCSAKEKFTIKTCSIHGDTKHQGDSCCKCANEKQYSTRFCQVCQDGTIHNGLKCMPCLNRSMITEKVCSVHGLTKFRGNTCCQCSADKRPKKEPKQKIIEHKICSTCKKNARHVDGKCMSCKEQALYKELECPIHGLTKHRGKTCCQCRSEKMRQKREEKKMKK